MLDGLYMYTAHHIDHQINNTIVKYAILEFVFYKNDSKYGSKGSTWFIVSLPVIRF